MFISEDVANERLRSSHNVLTVIQKDGDRTEGEAHVQEPIVVEPDEILPEDAACSSAVGIIEAPNGALLRKMLGLKLGRQKGVPNMPREVQAAAAVTAQLTTLKNASDVFETSVHHAHELKHGYTNQESQYGPDAPDKALENIINRQKREVRDLAFQKLTKALGLITDDKLMAVTDVTKLSRISKDLSGVVDKVLPKENVQLGGVHFHVWRPDMRDESSYEQVVVGNGQ